jgi:hypothetical protein
VNQFFIVGAQRSGTTWLYQMLQQHPQICMAQPIRPEPKYFLGQPQNCNQADYCSRYFDNLNSNILACGEKSTSYIESKLAAQNIARVFPQAKIIMLLRNPLQRAISNYQFSVDNGIETRTLEEAIFKTKAAPILTAAISTDPFDYLGRGLYQRYLDIYQQYFASSSILLLCNELIVKDLTYLRQTYQFLGVDPDFTPDNFSQVENRSHNNTAAPQDVLDYLSQYYLQTRLAMQPYFDSSCWS